ncbi:hypothetical protein [Methanopyrus kandleri]|uniref:Uncharacterized protein n=1 Tax=Methanopyrus kandleri (strain AV19 / DSM 6324 / JCM 9639 / NBRC 100938) TaxID=190192 RepID=Q8TVP7_METKA|nr:hypothetical protein [Methanopyrus kandleri]AAM02554.1 Uncharacterized protein MK1341 [Methanopyrus kandleri AV19]
MTVSLTRALGMPSDVLHRPVFVPRLPPEYALVGLAAYLTALATRHYLGPLDYLAFSALVPAEGFFVGCRSPSGGSV